MAAAPGGGEMLMRMLGARRGASPSAGSLAEQLAGMSSGGDALASLFGAGRGGLLPPVGELAKWAAGKSPKELEDALAAAVDRGACVSAEILLDAGAPVAAAHFEAALSQCPWMFRVLCARATAAQRGALTSLLQRVLQRSGTCRIGLETALACGVALPTDGFEAAAKTAPDDTIAPLLRVCPKAALEAAAPRLAKMCVRTDMRRLAEAAKEREVPPPAEAAQFAHVQGASAATLCELRRAGADPNAASVGGITGLHAAARSAAGESLLLALLLMGARPDARDADGNLPLHLAKTGWAVYALVELAEGGRAALETVNSAGRTPLAVAAYHGRGEAGLALLAQGADPAAKDPEDRLPVDHLWRKPRGTKCAQALGLRLLELGGGGERPLHRVAACADAWAVHAVVEWLRSRGKLAETLRERDAGGCTPLHIAAGRSQITEPADILLAAGADPRLADPLGATPLDVAGGGCARLIRAHIARTGAAAGAADKVA